MKESNTVFGIKIEVHIITNFMCNEYVQFLKIQGLTEDSIKYYLSYIKNFIIIAEFVSYKDFNNLLKLKFSYYKLAERGICNNTIYKYYKCIKKYYTFLKENGLVDSIYINEIKKIKTTSSIPKSLTEQEILKIRDCFINDRTVPINLSMKNYLIFETFLNTGIRRKELVNLTKDCVFKDYIIVKSGKGSKDRIVYITKKFSKLISDWIETQNNDNGYVFIEKDGSKLKVDNISHLFHKFSKITKIHVHPHLLRHCYASICVKRGINLYTLQQQLGHADLKTTSIYLYLNNSENYNEIQKFEI